MTNIAVVEVVSRVNDLLYDFAGCFLIAASFVLGDEFQQLSALCELHDDVNVLLVFKGFVELDDIGVVS